MSAERLVPVVIRLFEKGRERTVPVGQAFVSDTEVVVSLEPLVFTLGDSVARAEPAGSDETEPDRPAPREPGRRADLEWLAERSRRVLSDPRKLRWHGDVRAQLAEIEAELARLKDRSPG